MNKREALEEIRNYTREALEDLKEYYDSDISELHNELFNTNYIIGTYEALKWLGEDALDIIGAIKEYEEDNFGEVNTDLTNAEAIVNMYVYILGEEILYSLDTYSNNIDRNATPEIIQELIDELN